MKGEAKFFASLKEISEKRQKKPSAIPKIWVPRVKVLNYLKKVALFLLNLTLSKSVGDLIKIAGYCHKGSLAHPRGKPMAVTSMDG